MSEEQTTWATCGLNLIEQLVMRQVARQFPDGPVAEAVRILDARSAEGQCPVCRIVSPDHLIQCPKFEKD